MVDVVQLPAAELGGDEFPRALAQGAVGVEARGGEALEYENDPSRKFLMSNKARAIERNLGIGD